MPALTPLGRSLLPLPEESLSGFVLRLSYRLNLAPARITQRTGLTPPRRGSTRTPARFLAEMPTEIQQVFAHTTRLTGEQVHQLVLASLHERYPLPHEATRTAVADRRLLNIRTVFLPHTRFCPTCLAGDGSPIQNAFGGPWKKIWHLPVVFACPAHQRLLEHRCPRCEQLVHGRQHEAPGLLLPAMRARPLHPAQCRAAIGISQGRTLLSAYA
jgi:hypothetical protein